MSGDDMIKLYWKTVSILLAGIVLVVLGLYFIKGTEKKEQETESVVTENSESGESLVELPSEQFQNRFRRRIRFCRMPYLRLIS